MKKGDYIETPRFLTVRIAEMYDSTKDEAASSKDDYYAARRDGFTEPTHYHINGYTVLGKSISENRMIFAGVWEGEK